jgi:antibiotic biosynthesis monooxygenase (ABM) superfamily enzyme
LKLTIDCQFSPRIVTARPCKENFNDPFVVTIVQAQVRNGIAYNSHAEFKRAQPPVYPRKVEIPNARKIYATVVQFGHWVLSFVLNGISFVVRSLVSALSFCTVLMYSSVVHVL